MSGDATLDAGPLAFRPVTADAWPDMERLFSEHGVQNGCWCMYWRVKRADFHAQYGEPNRKAMLRIVEDGRVPGILAYYDHEPVAWCSVAPRGEFPVLDRSRTLKPVDDEPAWSIVCFFVSQRLRQQGVSTALIRAAVDYAASNGARIVEAYPIVPGAIREPRYERYMGQLSTFLKLGFREVARRSHRRAIVHYAVAASTPLTSRDESTAPIR